MTKRTLRVLCNSTTPTPLHDILNETRTQGKSGTWRVNGSDLEECTDFEVYDEESGNKVGGPIVSYEYIEKTDTMGGGFEITFTPKEIGGSIFRSYKSTRPKFNRIGFDISPPLVK